MWMKLMGAVCLLAAGGWGWRQQRAADRRRMETLRDLTGALEEMGETVRLARMPLPRLLRRLQRGRSPLAAGFFAAVAQAAETGGDVSAVWREQAALLPLTDGERFALAEVGAALSGDEERVCRGLALAAERLRTGLEETRRQRPERDKRTAALWFSGAALLTILLM